MRRDVIGLVAKEDLAILEADAGGAQPMLIQLSRLPNNSITISPQLIANLSIEGSRQ